MKELKINLGNTLVIIKAVPFSHLHALETMLEELQSLWLKHEAAVADLLLSDDSALALDLAQKIINLHPRIDEPGKFGFDLTLLKDDLNSFESLFFGERDEDDNLSVVRGSRIVRLNKFDPLKKYHRAVALAQEQPPQDTTSPAVETSTQTS